MLQSMGSQRVGHDRASELIPQLPTLENLLNIFISNFEIEKLFLFDVVSKIYITTDSTPVDMQT